MYTYSAVDADEEQLLSPIPWSLWKLSSKIKFVLSLIVICSLFPACFLAGRASIIATKSEIERKFHPKFLMCIFDPCSWFGVFDSLFLSFSSIEKETRSVPIFISGPRIDCISIQPDLSPTSLARIRQNLVLTLSWKSWLL